MYIYMHLSRFLKTPIKVNLHLSLIVHQCLVLWKSNFTDVYVSIINTFTLFFEKPASKWVAPGSTKPGTWNAGTRNDGTENPERGALEQKTRDAEQKTRNAFFNSVVSRFDQLRGKCTSILGTMLNGTYIIASLVSCNSILLVWRYLRLKTNKIILNLTRSV